MSKLQKVNNLHEEAMDIAEEGYLLQKKGKNNASTFFSKAFEIEKKAAMLLVNDYDIEPTRSVLFQGAAYLANNANRFEEAKQMIGFALSGNPPIEIAEELSQLLIELSQKSAKNSTLNPNNIQKSIEKLPINLQQEVMDFIDFLKLKHSIN